MGVEVAIVGAVVGGLFSAYSAIQQGQAAQAAAQYQAQVAANNAKIAQQNANYARQVAAVKSGQVDQKTAALVASTRAAQAANGLDVNSGTDLDVQASTYAIGRMDAENVRLAGEREAYGYETQAMNFRATSGLYDFQGDQAMQGAWGKALGSLIGTASSVGSKWASFQQAGLLAVGSGGWVDNGAWT